MKSGYGLWLPGDTRGHWSTGWDEKIGHYEPHHLHIGDPMRKRMAQERMRHPPTRFSTAILKVIAQAVATCASESDWKIAAAAFESTHMHLLMTFSECDVDGIAKWLAQRTTKGVHKRTSFSGPLWCEGKWLEFVFDRSHYENIRDYIERHNLRRGLPAQPWPSITETALECSRC